MSRRLFATLATPILAVALFQYPAFADGGYPEGINGSEVSQDAKARLAPGLEHRDAVTGAASGGGASVTAGAAMGKSSSSIQRAEGEVLAEATGHYSRARSLLLAAINEFDAGYRVADPSALLDAKKWRASLVDRATELERVLDPQPKASKGGVKFNADKRLLNEAKR